MGVPSYFHWLLTKFEDEILKAAPNHNASINQNSERMNEIQNHNQSNPDDDTSYLGIKIDRLYLDLNCAIHPAVKMPGLSRQDMYIAVGNYLDDILRVAVLRPSRPCDASSTRLVYIAIDGVAPRAKMSQQRKRRYKAVQDTIDVNAIKQKFGIPIEEHEDFNMISPGTKFMEELSDYLNQKIRSYGFNDTSPKLKFIFSDANVPGEGEHKIMDHIRQNPPSQNESIAIYGLDADLIFLCLANYCPNMYLLREKVHFGPKFKCSKKKDVEYVYLSIDALRSCLLKILNPT